MSGACRISFGEVMPTRCELLRRQPFPSYWLPGLPNQNFHAGLGSIPATKKKKKANPAALTRWPNAAPIAITASKKHSSETGGLRNRSMLGVCADGRAACVARALSPEVDATVGRVPIDLCKLVVRELEIVERRDVRLELLEAADAHEGGRDALVAQRPCERQLRERLSALLRDLVQG